MLRGIRRRFAPWVGWELYQRLTLGWGAAQSACCALGEPASNIEVRAIERSELERLASDPGYEISRRFLDGLAMRQDLCVGGFVSGRLACYGFYAVAPTDIDEQLRFHFPERWLYVYKGFTHPQFRGMRMRGQVLLRGVRMIEEWLGPIQAPFGLVTLVVSDNEASLKALHRIGFQQQDRYRVARLGPLAYPLEGNKRGFFIHRIRSRPVAVTS